MSLTESPPFSNESGQSGQPGPVRRLVIYKPKPGAYPMLANVLRRHGPLLKSHGLITSEGVRVYRACDDSREGATPEPYLIETFKWKDEAAMRAAHDNPEVMALWQEMDAFLQSMTLTTLEALTM
jgi:hypothetical protein